ncbi:hypothetical protein CR513_41487, partial [Mucuna pruriens]
MEYKIQNDVKVGDSSNNSGDLSSPSSNNNSDDSGDIEVKENDEQRQNIHAKKCHIIGMTQIW